MSFTRRELLATTARLGAASALGSVFTIPGLEPRPVSAGTGFLSTAERQTLDAALGRMIPAEGPGDWSAATVGAGDYIDGLLSIHLESDPNPAIFAGGPVRQNFDDFQELSRVKRIGWKSEIERLRLVYKQGLADLDGRAGGSFAARPAEIQDAILETLDLEGHPFFAALYAHTMEGVYSHPVYGGNKDFKAWKEFCYQGDVHGVRFPNVGDPTESWNVHGGYAPEEMIEPGKCPGQGPKT